MSAQSSSPFSPVIVASAVTSGGSGGGTIVVSGLPSTGTGLVLLISVMALVFILVGAFLVWNPLGRRSHRPAMVVRTSAPQREPADLDR